MWFCLGSGHDLLSAPIVFAVCHDSNVFLLRLFALSMMLELLNSLLGVWKCSQTRSFLLDNITCHFGVMWLTSWEDQHFGLTTIPRDADRNISTQHFPTLLAQHLKALAKRSQHLNATSFPETRDPWNEVDLNATHHNIVGRIVWPPCCDVLRVENRTTAHVWAHHWWTDLAKRLQHRATLTNVAWFDYF